MRTEVRNKLSGVKLTTISFYFSFAFNADNVCCQTASVVRFQNNKVDEIKIRRSVGNFRKEAHFLKDRFFKKKLLKTKKLNLRVSSLNESALLL